MTVASEQAHIAYIADGRQTRFPLPFTVNSAQALRIAWADDRNRDVFYRPGSDYTIAGNQLLFTHPPPAGRRLTLVRADPLTQPTRLAENDRFYACTIEAGFDRLTGQIQRVHELAERCPALPLSSGMRQVTLHPPSAGAVLRWDSEGRNIVSDSNFGAALLEARDQVLAARTAAATSAALAQQAASLAPAAIAAANQALQAASRAIAAQAIVQAAAERASWALGLMGLANNLTQLLYTVAPFLTRLFGLWKDFGWINQSVHITVDFGWACMASINRCRDFGLILDSVDRNWDLAIDGKQQDWGEINDQVDCYLPLEPVCLDDLGWINTVLPLNASQPITLPIRVPDPCPVIFAEPSPPPPASGAFQC